MESEKMGAAETVAIPDGDNVVFSVRLHLPSDKHQIPPLKLRGTLNVETTGGVDERQNSWGVGGWREGRQYDRKVSGRKSETHGRKSINIAEVSITANVRSVEMI
jgi:hypothetical protein